MVDNLRLLGSAAEEFDVTLKQAALLLAVLSPLGAGGTTAQTPPGAWPRCVAERDGQQIGLGGSVCECRRERGGAVIGRPAGGRWCCDLLRSDGSELGIPADNAPRRGLPPGFTYAPQGGSGSLADPAEPRLFERPYRP